MKAVKKYIILIAFILIAAYMIGQFLGFRAVVKGSSMEPALENNDSIIIDRFSYLFQSPKRYDIVICHGIPEGSDGKGKRPFFIKRIIGLPGEKIGIRDGKVTINGKVLKSDIYGKEDVILQSADRPDMLLPGDYRLKKDEYFLMGDNRNHSRDSRDPMLGPVWRKDLLGRALVRIWPLSKLGSIR